MEKQGPRGKKKPVYHLVKLGEMLSPSWSPAYFLPNPPSPTPTHVYAHACAHARTLNFGGKKGQKLGGFKVRRNTDRSENSFPFRTLERGRSGARG